MDHFRRSKPVWRSVIGPVSLGLLWPSILGAFWFYILTEFGNPLAVEAVNQSIFARQDAAESSTAPRENSFVRDDSLLSHARLRIAGDLVVDAPLTHLGHVQSNPDGSLVAFDLFPTGTETLGLGQIHIYDLSTGNAVATMAGYAPVWNEQSQLEFTTPEEMAATFDLDTGLQVEEAVQTTAETQEDRLQLAAADAIGTFQPHSIRVRHHPQNYCRQSVAHNEITEIALEEYVARVLPAEVPPTWEMEALKAVAIAVRTYAWNKIYQNRADTYPFDVSDWVNNQVMCDYRHARSDLAAQATVGVIIQDVADPNRLPILSMYSAENAHPTKKHSYLTYLDSVPDPNALGMERRGHGWGLSQLGAQRFARQGLNYCQILGHYYSDIHISSSTPNAPLGCLIVNDARDFVVGSGIHIEAVVPANSADLTVEINDITSDTAPVPVAYVAPDVAAMQAAQESQPEDPVTTDQELPADAVSQIQDTSQDDSTSDDDTVVDVSEFPLTLPLDSRSYIWFMPRDTMSGTVLELKLLTGTQLLDTVRVTVDHEGPDHVQASLFETDSREQLLVKVTGASGDGLSMGRDWTWEQSALAFTEDSGTIAQDMLARDGQVWLGDPALHTRGAWYGPYTSVLPGARSYRALFRLRLPEWDSDVSDILDSAQPIARLDVTQAQGAKVLGFRDLYVTDFRSADVFTHVGVDFHLFEAVTDLEFRVHWYDTHMLALDQVTVVSYPFRDWANTNFIWPVVPDTPVHNLRFVAFDVADNMSTLFTLNLDQSVTELSAQGMEVECQLYGNCLYPSLDMNYPSAIQ